MHRKISGAQSALRGAEGYDSLRAQLEALLGRMDADLSADHATRDRWRHALVRVVVSEPEFSRSRLGQDLLAVADAYGVESWDADSN
jgi:hypothetical protein